MADVTEEDVYKLASAQSGWDLVWVKTQLLYHTPTELIEVLAAIIEVEESVRLLDIEVSKARKIIDFNDFLEGKPVRRTHANA